MIKSNMQKVLINAIKLSLNNRFYLQAIIKELLLTEKLQLIPIKQLKNQFTPQLDLILAAIYASLKSLINKEYAEILIEKLHSNSFDIIKALKVGNYRHSSLSSKCTSLINLAGFCDNYISYLHSNNIPLKSPQDMKILEGSNFNNDSLALIINADIKFRNEYKLLSESEIQRFVSIK